MKVLVTGSRGFIGSALVAELRQGGHQVLTLGRSSKEADLDYEATLGEQSLIGRYQVPDLDCVIHLAAPAHTHPKPGEMDFAERVWSETVDGTAELLAWLGQRKVPRFIYVSSVKAGQADKLSRSQVYARAKAAAEEVVFKAPGAFDRLIVRLPIIYGETMQSSLKHFLKLQGKAIIPIVPALGDRRPLLALPDLISALMSVIISKSLPKMASPLLISDNESYSLNRLSKLAKQQVPVPWHAGLRDAAALPLFFTLKTLALVFPKFGQLSLLTEVFDCETTDFEEHFNWRAQEKLSDHCGSLMGLKSD